jgi:beta-aspartyl-peptidase (threonine type)
VEALGDPHAACRAAIEVLEQRVNGLGGVILLTPDGRPGWHYNTAHIAYAYRTVGMEEIFVGL